MNLQEGLLTYLAPKISGTTASAVVFVGAYLLCIVVGYLLGSVNSAIILSKCLYRDDIRKHGSGNAGLTNMLRTYGKGAAGLTLLGDVLKTGLAVAFGGFIFGFQYVGGISVSEGCYLAGFFAVVGHVFPAYFKMKGGKGVLALVTVGVIVSPFIMLALIGVFFIILALSKYVSLGSVCIAVIYPLAVFGYFKVAFSGQAPNGIISLVTVLAACLIVFRHTENLRRIGERTENKFSFKGRSDK